MTDPDAPPDSASHPVAPDGPDEPPVHTGDEAAARVDSVLALAEPVHLAERLPEAPATDEASPEPPDAPESPPPHAGEDEIIAILAEMPDQPKPAVGQAGAESDEPALPPPAVDDEMDETTTLVLADPHPDPHHDEEVTTFLPSPPAQPLEDDEATTLVRADPHAGEDEPTMLLAASAYDDDEATTLVQAGADEVADEPTYILPADEPLPLPAGPPPALPAAEAEEGVTEIRPASLPAGASQGPPDWFTQNLQLFTQSLRQDATGAARPPQEMQQLALTARDMIARIAMQAGTRTAAEGWSGDTVLQPDQLLANTYIVRSLIARGGVGEIYRTRHRDLRTEHAIKVLLPRYALDPTVLTLMQDEARLLACIRHEAVVRLQDLLRDADGRPMLVMDFLRGRTLSARLREGRLATPELVVLARRLAEGLTAIHAAGIVHQDISPDNIILADDSCGAATIIDFGLARRVGTGRDMHRNLDFAGKYSWSSPEQLSGRPAAVDARSDLYSLGLMLAAAARGYRLDMGQDLDTARAARTTVPSLAGIEQPLAGLIEALLAPAPESRLGSATDIEAMLEPRPRSLWSRLAPYFGLKR